MLKVISSKRMLVIGITGIFAFLIMTIIGVYISIFLLGTIKGLEVHMIEPLPANNNRNGV